MSTIYIGCQKARGEEAPGELWFHDLDYGYDIDLDLRLALFVPWIRDFFRVGLVRQ